MNKDEILNYIKQNNGAEAAAIQRQFGVSYKEAKAIIDELVCNGTLVYESGVKYSYVKKEDTLERRRAELKKRREEAISKKQDNEAPSDDDESKRRIAYLEARRRELVRRMQAEMEEDSYEEDDDSGEDDGEIDEELHFKALKLIIEKNSASVSLFQRSFPIGYLRACSLIDWLESKGYVSTAQGAQPRKVLITKEEFEKLYCEPRLLPDEDNVNDSVENEEGELYDKIINRIFHSDESKTLNEDISERKAAMQRLVTVLNQIAEKKKAPISADEMPSHPSWDNEDEFAKVVRDRIERLVSSDKRMGKYGAIKKAETYLNAVRDTNDRKMVQVYERLVYEIKNASNYLYGQLKKRLFDE